MHVTVKELPIEQYELDKVLPADVADRVDGENWLVREQPLETQLGNRWSLTREGRHVRVPLYKYIVAGKEPARAMAMAFKLGARGIQEMPPGWEILRLHIVFGQPVQEASDGLRFWVGFAVVIKPQAQHYATPHR